MSKASIIDEIQNWRKRAGHFSDYRSLVFDFTSLRHDWNADDKHCQMYYSYYIIKSITLLELTCRDIVRSACNHSPAMLAHAEDLFKSNVRFDFGFAAALHGKIVSIGDVIAHSLNFGSVDKLLATMEKILDAKPIKKGLSTVVDKAKIKFEGAASNPIIADIDLVLTDVSRAFKARHILVHENPQNQIVDTAQIEGILDSVESLVQALFWLTTEILYGDIPLTQADINQDVYDKVEKLDAKMLTIIDAIKSKSDVDINLLETSQVRWQAFVEAESTLRASVVEGGSMYPALYGSAKQQLIEERVEHLSQWLMDDDVT